MREDMVDQTRGILATGPEFIIDAYEKVLTNIGADVLMGCQESRDHEGPGPYAVTWADSYFIVGTVVLTRIE